MKICEVCPYVRKYYLVVGFSVGSGLVNVATLLKVYGVIP